MLGMIPRSKPSCFFSFVWMPYCHCSARYKMKTEAYIYILILYTLTYVLVEQINQQGGNENLVRNVLMALAETLVAVCVFADYLAKTHGPWDAEKVLHLVSSHAFFFFVQ